MGQTDFIALYRGQTVADARLVAVTAEPEIVSRFFREMIGTVENMEPAKEQDGSTSKRLRVVRGSDE